LGGGGGDANANNDGKAKTSKTQIFCVEKFLTVLYFLPFKEQNCLLVLHKYP